MKISYKAIGNNIKTARVRVGLSQEATAERLGMSPMHFGRLERGERRISLDQLAQISEIFELSIETLLFGASDQIPISLHGLGSIINFLAAGCCEETRGLMLDLCHFVAMRDKYSGL